jgi:hypothetical protein
MSAPQLRLLSASSASSSLLHMSTSAHPFERYHPYRFKAHIFPDTAIAGRRYAVDEGSSLHSFCVNMGKTSGHWLEDKHMVDPLLQLCQVEAIYPTTYAVPALDYTVHKKSTLRHNNIKNTTFNHDTSTFTVEQLRVLDALRHCFLEREPGTPMRKSHFVYCFHGARLDALDNICDAGLVALRKQDTGFYGAGIYTTLNMEYAARYACGDYDKPKAKRVGRASDGAYPVILMVASVGMAYPVTPDVDRHLLGTPIKPGFDCHVACVREGNEVAVNRHDCKYVELVFDQEAQLLPLAVLWFIDARPQN